MKFSLIVFGALVAYAAAHTLDNGPVIDILQTDIAQQVDKNRDKRFLLGGLAGVAGIGAVGLGAGLIGAKAGLIGGALVGSALHGHGRSYGGYGYGGYGGYGGYHGYGGYRGYGGYGYGGYGHGYGGHGYVGYRNYYPTTYYAADPWC